MRHISFFIAFLLCVLFLNANSAYAQTCLPGLPCPVALTPNNPNNGPNAAKSESAACDADFMNQITARAFLEASRETMMASVLIRKPDSVLEYTCFDQEAKKSADYAGAIFTETERFKNIDVPNVGSGSGGLGSLLGTITSGIGSVIDLPGALAQAAEQLGGIENLKLPEGMGLSQLVAEVEGLDGEALQAKIRDIAPDTFDQLSNLADLDPTEALENVSNTLTKVANVSVEDTRQALFDFAEASADENLNALQTRLVDGVNQTLGDTREAITGAINRVENIGAQLQGALEGAEAVVAAKDAALKTAEEAFDYARGLDINKVEIDAAGAAVDRARAGLEGAENAAQQIAAEFNALENLGNDLINQADGLLGDADAFADRILSGSPEEIASSLASTLNLADEATKAVEAVNTVANDVTRLAEGATELISGAARVAEILEDPAGAAISFAKSLLPTEVGQFLSLGGIEDSIEIPLSVAFDTLQLDLTLDSVLSGSLNDFVSKNFSHDFLGGAAVKFNNSISRDADGNPKSNVIINADGSCAFMNSVYFVARCNDFGLDDQFSLGDDDSNTLRNPAFKTFSQLAQEDLRSLPQTCGSTMFSVNIIDVAANKGFQYASFDRVDSFVRYAETNNCQPPVPTGLKVRQDIYETDINNNVNLVEQRIFDDMICVNPGCYFSNGSCVNG